MPIRRLAERHRPRLLRHLLSLSPDDRYLRFGYPASDACIARYVTLLDFRRDEVFGIYNRHLQLVATSHLAHAQADPGPIDGDPVTGGRMVEFAVSVLVHARGRGYGERLFAHAVRYARNRSVDRMAIHALRENTAMLRIARKGGATVQTEGGEAEAWLQLPRHNLASRVEEIVADRVSALNYRFKVRVLQATWLAALIGEVKRWFTRRGQLASQ